MVAVAGSCARPDAVTAPIARAHAVAKSVLGPGFVDNGLCGTTCVLLNNTGPLWSAIAYPDSVSIPVSIADVKFAPAVGDSLAIQIGGDSAVLAAVGSSELIDISDGLTHSTYSLAALAQNTILWRFTSTDSTTLHFTINRTLADGVEGQLVLVASGSASMVSATRPWYAPSDASGLLLSVRSRSQTLGGTRRNDANAACKGTVTAQFSFQCGVLVIVQPFAAADGFQNVGAKFQSGHGHGASSGINVTFSSAVSSVTIVAYDPTFAGNQATATGAATPNTLPFPGNNKPGVPLQDTVTFHGAITSVALTPASADYVAYSMTFSVGGGSSSTTLSITSAAGPHKNGSFTTIRGESNVTLLAVVSPSSLAPSIKWTVEDDPNDFLITATPSTVADGSPSVFSVPDMQPAARFATYKHRRAAVGPLRLDSLALSLRVRAQVTDNNGQVVKSSDSVTARQDTIDTIRQAYQEIIHFHGIPPYGAFIPTPRDTPSNAGDFDFALLDPVFAMKLDSLKAAFTSQGNQWQVNVIYRDPMHNKYHANSTTSSGVSSGSARNSWHIYGCAADIQTFPSLLFGTPTASDSARAQAFHDRLALMAGSPLFKFNIEAQKPARNGRLGSGVGHVHVDFCPN